jgi:prevent-host-death family protein
MSTVSTRDAKNKFIELGRRAEAGERIVVTRNGKPVFDIVPHVKKGGLNLQAGEAFLRARGIKPGKSWISPDFDDPLPEDFLSTPITYPDER